MSDARPDTSQPNRPWLSLGLTLLALGLSLQPDALATLCFDRQAIFEQQQWWRLLSGHLVHSSPAHLGWDLLAFCGFSVLVERRSRCALIVALALAWLLLTALLLSSWGLARYCGLSGLLCAPAVVALWWHHKCYRHISGYHRWISLLPLLAGGLKLMFEAGQSQALIADGGWPLYAPAHWAGVCAGALLLGLQRLERLRFSKPTPTSLTSPTSTNHRTAAAVSR